MQFEDQLLADDLNRIMDVFAGTDGGVDYVKLRMALLAIEKQKVEGDTAAAEIIETVHRFARLINILTSI